MPWNLPFIVSSDDFDGPRIHVEKKWHTVYESTVPTQTINAQKLVVFSIPYGHFISYIGTSIQFFFLNLDQIYQLILYVRTSFLPPVLPAFQSSSFPKFLFSAFRHLLVRTYYMRGIIFGHVET